MKDHSSEQRILKAARSLFSRHGYAAVSVREIAEEAEVNPSALNYHFGGKEGLYSQCLEEFDTDRKPLLKRILQCPDSSEEFRTRLVLACEEFWEFIMTREETVHLILRELRANEVKSRAAKIYLSIFEDVVDFFVAAKQKDLLRKDADPLTLASMMYFYFQSLFQNQTMAKKRMGVDLRNSVHRKHLVSKTVDALLGGAIGS